MAVPLPDADTVNLVPPDERETELLARACSTAAAAPGGVTEVQRAVFNATVDSMSGYVLDVGKLPPLGPDEFAAAMRRRDRAFRERMVQVMLLLVPLPPDFGVPEKSAKAVAAGSVSPWEPGGISRFQYQRGRETAESFGREYDSYGATPT